MRPSPCRNRRGTNGSVLAPASMGCHNANGLKGDWRSEYTTWLVYDRHARAFEVLFDRKSDTIVKKLNLAGGKPASQQTLCLNCHVHKDYERADHHPRFTKEDGVSCESCHGPAADWVSEHYKPQWRAWSVEKKGQQGFWDTRRSPAGCGVAPPATLVLQEWTSTMT